MCDSCDTTTLIDIFAKSFPVDFAEAVFDYFFKMLFGAVAFVLIKTILGIFFVHIHHNHVS